MEQFYPLLILLSGITIVLLGFCLVAAEREIRKKRGEIEALRTRPRAVVETDQGGCDRCAGFEAELSQYRQQLERSQARVRELESGQEGSAENASCAMSDPDQQRKLEELIGDLERELAEGKSQVAALEETHERLRETERICSELAAENHRLREEIAHWQGRFAATEENQGHVDMLRQQLSALQSEHALASDSNRQMQEPLAAVTEPGPGSLPVEKGSGRTASLVAMVRAVKEAVKEWMARWTELRQSTGVALEANEPVLGAQAGKEAKANGSVWASFARNHWRGAAVAGVVTLVIAGAFKMISLSSDAPKSSDPLVFAPEATLVDAPAARAEKIQPKPAPRIRGAFRTVRPTQVFSGPSENSALVANIGAGMRLNVIGSQNGWLEIRSKHGRPPGFVRQEAAVRVGSN